MMEAHKADYDVGKDDLCLCLHFGILVALRDGAVDSGVDPVRD